MKDNLNLEHVLRLEREEGENEQVLDLEERENEVEAQKEENMIC